MKVTETHVFNETYEHPENGSEMTVSATLEIDLQKGGLFSIKTTTETKEIDLEGEQEATEKAWKKAWKRATKIKNQL